MSVSKSRLVGTELGAVPERSVIEARVMIIKTQTSVVPANGEAEAGRQSPEVLTSLGNIVRLRSKIKQQD
jgi:hypothetical protein